MDKFLCASIIIGETGGITGGVYNIVLCFVDVEAGQIVFSVFKDINDPKMLLPYVRALADQLAAR